MISYLINAVIETISPEDNKDQQQKPRKTKKKNEKDDLVDRKTLNKIKSETFSGTDRIYPRSSQTLLNDTVPAFRPSYYNTTAAFRTSTEKSMGGWVCYNDDKLRPLIESFPELNIMPKGDVQFWINANWKNVDRVVLLYACESEEDDKFIGLLAELRKSTNGNVILICLSENQTQPAALSTLPLGSYIYLITRKDSLGYGEAYVLDDESRNRVTEFVKTELAKIPSFTASQIVNKKIEKDSSDLVAEIFSKEYLSKGGTFLAKNNVDENLVSSSIPARKTESYAYKNPISNSYSSDQYYRSKGLGIGEVLTSDSTYNFSTRQQQPRPEKYETEIFSDNKIVVSSPPEMIYEADQRIFPSPFETTTRIVIPRAANETDLRFYGGEQRSYFEPQTSAQPKVTKAEAKVITKSSAYY